MTTETAGAPTAVRESSLDTLRTILVAWIIGGHALLGYSTIGGWGYDEVNEVAFHPQVELVLAAILGPTALFLMGTFFLVAGLFTPQSLDKKGAKVFLRERSLRLGLPFLVSAFVVWPISMWIAYRSSGRSVSYGFLLTGRDRLIDSGGLWFAEVLLLFSVGYVIWLQVAGRRTRGVGPGGFTLRQLAALAVGIALVTFFIRRWVSARGTEVFDLHLWQWPQLAAMFALGIIGARKGLASRVPARIGRTSGWITLVAVVAGPALALALGVDDTGGDLNPFLSGWRREAFALAAFEGILVVFGSLWLLRFAQLRLSGERPFMSRMARGSFAAFILQGPVLIIIAVALRPLPLPAEVKAPVVMVAGIVACFGLGWLLVTRTRVGRIV
ncbi:acyltransferase [Nocardioides sp.]|uniref:acyltransferase family protein n=1 Tax=Nocardioides sp. TaxID=35761 RepID=UPI002735CF49|nr:acyltransferase [Nocardioides sp.]MDP3894070.1 acyltransferase [Nocardioides sp.]